MILKDLLVSLVVMALAGPCAAQTWTVAFEPGEASFTPDHHQIADAVAAAVAAIPAGRMGFVRLELEGPADGRAVWRLRTTALELAERGLQASSTDGVFLNTTPPQAPQDAGSRIRIIVASEAHDASSILHRFVPTITFDTGRADISPEGRFLLAYQVVGPHLRTVTARIEAYADTQGDAGSNLRLAQKRAEAVADELIRIGMPFGHVQTSAFGESALAVPSKDGVPEAGNRRAIVRLVWPLEPGG